MKSIEKSGKSTATAAIGAGVGAGINLISQGINIARGKQKKFNVGSFLEVLLKAELLQE